MTYNELSQTKELLDDVIEGKEIKVDSSTKINLTGMRDYLNNLILDIDKKKIGSNEKVMYYRVAIEVKN